MNTDYKQTDYVWYACYGSNINKTRFMRYIVNCSDTTPPVEDRAFTLPYNVYFADKSAIWDDKAVAFIDDTKPGHALGRIYKITREQYEDVKMQEGSKYTKGVELGEHDGLSVYTFTCQQQYEQYDQPAESYVNTILHGLEETYPEKTTEELKAYLDSLGK